MGERFRIVCVRIVVTLIVCGVSFVSVLFRQVSNVGGLSVGWCGRDGKCKFS